MNTEPVMDGVEAVLYMSGFCLHIQYIYMAQKPDSSAPFVTGMVLTLISDYFLGQCTLAPLTCVSL